MVITLENLSARNFCIGSRRISHVAAGGFFRKSFLLVGFLFALCPALLYCAADPSSSIYNSTYREHVSDLEGEIQNGIKATEDDIHNLMVKIRVLDLAPERGPETLISVQDNEARKRLKTFLNSAVKMRAKQLDHLKKQKSYLVEDSAIAKSMVPLNVPEGKNINSGNFQCHFFPLKQEEESTFEKVFSFGDSINPTLGKSSAKTQGIWWGNTFGTLVRTCAAGEIVMSEFIPGRGHVVGIRHNARDITLYGNLDSASLKSLKPGMKIPEGAPLGFALERFYFEARRGTDAVDPDTIMSDLKSEAGQDSDAKFKIN